MNVNFFQFFHWFSLFRMLFQEKSFYFTRFATSDNAQESYSLPPSFQNFYSSGSYFKNSLLKRHIGYCRKYPVACPNICGEFITREMVRLQLLSFYIIILLKYKV